MNFTNDQKRKFENLANNTPNLKDHKGNGIGTGKAKRGYFILKDHRVIKLRDIGISPEGNELKAELQALAERFDDMKDLSGIGQDRNTNKAKPGYFVDDKGKTFSIKNLRKAEAAAAKDTKSKDGIKEMNVTDAKEVK